MSSNSKKVVLVNQTSGYLMVDIVNAYADKYDTVALIAGTIEELDRRLDKRVILSKIVPYNKKNLFYRVLTWIMSSFQIFFLLFFKYRTYYVVYVTNPPVSYFTALLLRNTYSVIVYDIYPDALLNIKIPFSDFILKNWCRINKKVFSRAIALYTLSEGMAYLLSKYSSLHKIKVVSNWCSSEDLKPLKKYLNPFVREYQLEEKFVVMYSGNIGYTHSVEVILNLAKRVKKATDICFFIIGEGYKKKSLIKLAYDEHLVSCHFLPWQPAEKMKYSLGAADLSVITLTDETALVSVPSKTYNLLAIGSPLLCIAPKEAEISCLVENANCGKCFQKDDVESMVEYLLRLKEDQAYKKKLSQNALSASLNYTYKNAEQYVL